MTGKYKFEINLALHAILGIVCALFPILVVPWTLLMVVYFGTIRVYVTKNKYGDAHFAAAYVAGMEMMGRMSEAGLPHEMAKYAIILILFNGLIVQPRMTARSSLFLVFFLLLLPSILMLVNVPSMERARQLLAFNLSGPLCLTLSAIYFYRRPMSREAVARMFRNILLPIASIIGWLMTSTPKLSEVEFSFAANFETSGYGPNQMASVLGLGILLIGTSLIFRLKIFRSQLAAYTMLFFLGYRGLLTFSRGGILAPILILLLMLLYFFYSSSRFRARFMRIFIGVLFLVIGAWATFMYVNSVSGNALNDRYRGISYGKQVTFEKYTSGRLEIFKIDLKIFADHPLFGIGPGMGNEARLEYGYYEKAAAHIEFSRLLAEHGFFGIFSLLILIGFPLVEFLKRKSMESKLLLLAGGLFCLTFMLHSATRIALPMLMYGIGFVVIINQRKNGPLPRKHVV